MTDKINICRKSNLCPVGDNLYRCCETCEEPCDERPVCSRTDCDGLVMGDHRDLTDVKIDDMSRVLHAMIEEMDECRPSLEIGYSWKRNFVRGLDVPEKLKEKLVSPRRREW